MPPNLATEIAALPRLRVSELRAKFAVVFSEPTPSHNKVWLVKRIAWRLQALAEGDLSERARRRATELVFQLAQCRPAGKLGIVSPGTRYGPFGVEVGPACTLSASTSLAMGGRWNSVAQSAGPTPRPPHRFPT